MINKPIAMMVNRHDLTDALYHMRMIMKYSRERVEAQNIDVATHRYFERRALKAIKLLENILSEGA